MPGNPGSSLRCNECRTRRKKCDLQRPHCLRCRKSGIMCSGPRAEHHHRNLSFVHRQADASFPQQTQRQVLARSFRESRSSEHQHGNARALYDAFQERNREFLEDVLVRNRWVCPVASIVDFPTLALSSSPSPHSVSFSPTSAPASLFYAAILDEFRAGKPYRDRQRQQQKIGGIFSADRVRVDAGSREPRIYSSVAMSLRALCRMAVSTSAPCPLSLRMAIFGVLVLYIARLKGDDALLRKARRIYTDSLGIARASLNALVRASSASEQDNVGGDERWRHAVCFSIVLQLFEAFATDQFIDCMDSGPTKFVHGKGAMAILERVKLDEIASLEMSDLLHGFRALAVYQSIIDRFTSPFIEQEWGDTVPYRVEWSPRQQLLEIASGIPKLLSRIDKIVPDTPSRGDERPRASVDGVSIGHDILRIHHRLEEWLQNLESLYEGPLFKVADKPTTPSDSDDAKCVPNRKPSEAQLAFIASPVAGLLVTYWSFRLKLWMMAIEINTYSSNARVASHEDPPVETDNYLQRCQETVNLMLEAVPYLSSCLEGSLVLQAPLKILDEFFQKHRSFKDS